MPIAWSPEEQNLLKIVRETFDTGEIRRLFRLLNYDRTSDAIQKASKRLGVRFVAHGLPPLEGLSDQQLQAINAVVLNRQWSVDHTAPPPLSPAAKENASKRFKVFVQEMKDALSIIRQEVPRIGSLVVPKLSLPTEKNESTVLLLSDWHLGQIVTDYETNRQIYNLAIGIDRALQTPSLLFQALGGRIDKMKECVVLVGGDMVSGEGIFPSHEFFLETHAAEQVRRVTKTLWQVITRLREKFPAVRIVTVRGNHGRTGGAPESNWDSMSYQQLELLVDLEASPDLSIKNRGGEYAIAEIQGWKGLLRHEAPSQADTAAAVAKFSSWDNIHSYDWMAYGHWHHWGVFPLNNKPLLRNGALVGGDEYSEGLAKWDGPAQLAWIVTDSKPCAGVYPLYYEEVQG